MTVELIPFSAERDYSGFDCGSPALNGFLLKSAGRYQANGFSQTYLMTQRDEIAGFYSLAASSISCGELSKSQARRFPGDLPIPVILLARLAIDLKYQGAGLGKHLLMDALDKCYRLTGVLGWAFVVVDAKDDRARAFYEKFGFVSIPDQPLKLLLTKKKVIQAFVG